MTSPSFLDRITSPRMRSPTLPLHNSPKRPPSEYQLNQLGPRHDDASLLKDDLPRAWLTEPDVLESPRGWSPSSSHDKLNSAGSSSKKKATHMFVGPPPPITSSMIIGQGLSRASPAGPSGRCKNIPRSLVEHSQPGLGSVLSHRSHEAVSQSSDSLWRALQRREKALEQEVQQLLDLQATALVAGSGIPSAPSGNENDAYSTGSSTPASAFYSTKSSKSRMGGSLYVPTRTTPDGSVIPVRQPTTVRPRGLRATRSALQKSIAAMATLKQEESAHLEASLSQREVAIGNLGRLSARRANIHAELQILEEDDEEPLGKELREVGVRQDALDKEIYHLEEKLAEMRNQRRWLWEKTGEIKNKREAGLSGYRGALKDVDSEVTALMWRPPIPPLDPEMLDRNDEPDGGSGFLSGIDFLRLIPERRTMEMAKSWWEGEVVALERRKMRIDSDLRALREGGYIWGNVVQLVTKFESSLQQLMKTGAPSPFSLKGKEKGLSQQELIRDQLRRMEDVVEKLERFMKSAEEEHWNLLICAIGAELEAFKEAYAMLETLVEVPEDAPAKNSESLRGGVSEKDQSMQRQALRHYAEESDNKVPPDLLASHVNNQYHEDDASANPGDGASLQRYDSENEVPPEFLAEH